MISYLLFFPVADIQRTLRISAIFLSKCSSKSKETIRVMQPKLYIRLQWYLN